MTILSDASFTVDRALDAWIEQHTEDRPPDGAYHPSSIFMCDRKTMYEVRGTPREDAFQPGDRRPLFIGNTLGPVLQSAIEAQVGKTLRYAVSEPRIDVPEWNVVGNVDAFVIHMDGTPEVIENKTISPNSLRASKSKGEYPKPDHVNQGLTYLLAIKKHGYLTPVYDDTDDMCPNCVTPWKCNGPHLTTEQRPPRWQRNDPVPDLSRLRLCYWEKSGHKIDEFTIHLTDEWEEEFYTHIARLDKWRSDGTLPPRMPRGFWGCNYCAFSLRCWNIDGEGVSL